ncbi:MAG: lysophospholipid acyltransferase family protein [Spirochaetia bacterium]
MIKNFFYLVFLFFLLIISFLVVVLPYFFLKLLRMRRAARFIMYTLGRCTHRMAILGTGSRVELRGFHNFPENAERICFISNHQSYFDILLIVGYLPVITGFVAKKEIKKVPLLNLWTIALGSVFIDRKSYRSAIESIKQGVKYIKAGQPLLIFPEGTRSKSGTMGAFKAGSFKLAFDSDAVIVPLTVNKTYRIFEDNGRINGADITLTVHPPVETAGLGKGEKKTLVGELEKIVHSGLVATEES